ncbi:MAG: zinc ribbon domain-containing protein [Waterburya sp.]
MDRFFPSSKTCYDCHHNIDKPSLDVRNWVCPSCKTHHGRDENAAINIGAEGNRILQTSLGTSDATNGGNVRPKLGRVSRLGGSLWIWKLVVYRG